MRNIDQSKSFGHSITIVRGSSRQPLAVARYNCYTDTLYILDLTHNEKFLIGFDATGNIITDPGFDKEDESPTFFGQKIQYTFDHDNPARKRSGPVLARFELITEKGVKEFIFEVDFTKRELLYENSEYITAEIMLSAALIEAGLIETITDQG